MAVPQTGIPIWADTTGQTVQDSGVLFHSSTHTYYALPGGGASADTPNNGSFTAPFATLQYAINRAAMAIKTPFAAITVQLLGNTTENIVLPQIGGAIYTNTQGIVIDGGGFSISPASGVAILAVASVNSYFIRNFTIVCASDQSQGIEADQRSNISFGAMTINMLNGGSPTSAAVFCNDNSDINFYNALTVSGKGGALFSASDGGHIHYEPATLTLVGSPTITSLVQLIRGGSVTFTAAMTFSGAVTSANQVTSQEGDIRSVFQAALGVTWPAGSTQGNIGGVGAQPNSHVIYSSSSVPGFFISHTPWVSGVSVLAKDMEVAHDGATGYIINFGANGLIVGTNNNAQVYNLDPKGLTIPVAASVPGTPASGFVLYVDGSDSNKLKAKGMNGTITTLALQ